MIRKSTFCLEFANIGKKLALIRVLEEARRVINIFIQRLWELEKFTGKFANLKTETWLSARIQQTLGKQALEIVKSQRTSKIRRMPEFKALSINLDSRHLKVMTLKNSFDFWVWLSSLGDQICLRLPAKRHRHFNNLVQDGWHLKNSTRLSLKDGQLLLDVYFEKEAPPLKTEGKILGTDIGWNKLIVTSDGHAYGTDFKRLAAKIQRRKQGSKGFKKTLAERNDYIHKTVRQFPMSDCKIIVCEALKGLKNGRRFRKNFQAKFQRWTYPALVSGLKLAAERLGVLVAEVNPAYTSQTCSRCGCKDKKNRNGEMFTCISCGYKADADMNASVNILTRFRSPEHLDPVNQFSRISVGTDSS